MIVGSYLHSFCRESMMAVNVHLDLDAIAVAATPCLLLVSKGGGGRGVRNAYSESASSQPTEYSQ